MSTRRITVEEVLEAYRVTGVTPGTGNMRRCAIGTVLRAEGYNVERVCEMGETPNSFVVFGEPYSYGFTAGFDDEHGAPEKFSGNALIRWEEGYIDGQNARAAVFQEQGADQ